MKKLMLSILLPILFSVRLAAQIQVTVLYVNTNPPADNPGINTENIPSLTAMVNRLNAGVPLDGDGSQYSYVGGNLSVDTISAAATYAKNHPDERVVTIVHGVFDSTGTTFQNAVQDTNGNTAVSSLPKVENNSYYYCGMNGDNKTINANDIGSSLSNKFEGSYMPLKAADGNKKLDAPDSAEINEPDDNDYDDEDLAADDGSNDDWENDGGWDGGDDGGYDGGNDGGYDGGDDGDWTGSWYDS